MILYHICVSNHTILPKEIPDDKVPKYLAKGRYFTSAEQAKANLIEYIEASIVEKQSLISRLFSSLNNLKGEEKQNE